MSGHFIQTMYNLCDLPVALSFSHSLSRQKTITSVLQLYHKKLNRDVTHPNYNSLEEEDKEPEEGASRRKDAFFMSEEESKTPRVGRCKRGNKA